MNTTIPDKYECVKAKWLALTPEQRHAEAEDLFGGYVDRAEQLTLMRLDIDQAAGRFVPISGELTTVTTWEERKRDLASNGRQS